jgi:alpha-glucosidase
LIAGKTLFHDLPEPLLAFTRQTEDSGLLCLFNLSAKPKTLTLTGTSAPLDLSLGTTLSGHTLTLAANGAAFLPVTGEVVLTAS